VLESDPPGQSHRFGRTAGDAAASCFQKSASAARQFVESIVGSLTAVPYIGEVKPADQSARFGPFPRPAQPQFLAWVSAVSAAKMVI
jgi:hypothetical protein